MIVTSAIAGNWKQRPRCQPWRLTGNGEKLLHALNANILSGSVHSRTPCLGGVRADIAAAIAIAVRNEPVAASLGGNLIR
jgi:hypothetical protein